MENLVRMWCSKVHLIKLNHVSPTIPLLKKNLTDLIDLFTQSIIELEYSREY